jgi:NTE family protein
MTMRARYLNHKWPYNGSGMRFLQGEPSRAEEDGKRDRFSDDRRGRSRRLSSRRSQTHCEIKRVQTHGNSFPVIEGASAGAINGSALAAGSDDFALVTTVIAGLWSGLRPSDIFRCDVLSQTRTSFTWILDLSFGGVIGEGHARSLLDATPLKHFLNTQLKCDRITDNIKRGHLYALAISATNYTSGKSYLFIQGMKGHPMWSRSRRVTLATKITVEHICASAAIPLIFQPVRLKTAQGTAFFGDGCIRLQQPLSPVIRMGGRKDFRDRCPRPASRTSGRGR